MIRTILVALDGSARAPGVFAAAVEIARRFEAELVPLRAIFIPAEFPPAAHVVGNDPLSKHMIEDAERALAKLVGSAPGVRVAEPVVRHGQPWRVILEVSDELDVDLIAMGSHGYHGFDRVLGTTAGKVANLAQRNVLVVHRRPDRSSDPSTLPTEKDRPSHP